MNHIDRCLAKAAEAEKKGDKEKAKYWLDLAERFEKCFKGIKEMEMERKKKGNQRGGYNA